MATKAIDKILRKPKDRNSSITGFKIRVAIGMFLLFTITTAFVLKETEIPFLRMRPFFTLTNTPRNISPFLIFFKGLTFWALKTTIAPTFPIVKLPKIFKHFTTKAPELSITLQYVPTEIIGGKI